ncbi:MAG: hypothetical protein RL708_2620 [Bacteroidota bacterium]
MPKTFIFEKPKAPRMKKLFTLFIAITLFTSAKAQWVTIPDTNFANYLTLMNSSVMNGNQMDTSDIWVTSTVNLVCSTQLIKDLSGIKYFHSLLALDCSNNQLKSLPTLPSTLQYLVCANNQLSYLSNLPPNLFFLQCGNNLITSLPLLPSSLQTLRCYNNQLASLPTLPINLKYLNCEDNQIQNLPPLTDSLQLLHCYNNQLYCIPDLKNVASFLCNNNPLTCLPNYGWNNQLYTNYHNLYPICGLFNNSSCSMYWNISGTVYLDRDLSCSYDASDMGLKNIKVELWHNGDLEQQTFSRPDGSYTFDINIFDTFYIKIDTTNLPFYLSCPTQQVYASIISATDSIDANMNFGMQCKNLQDDISARNIITSRHRPAGKIFTALHAGLILNSGYSCSNNLGGKIKLFKVGNLNFLNSNSYSTAPTINSTDSLIWNITDFSSFDGWIIFNSQVDTQAQIGQSVCYKLIVEHNFVDADTKNDTLNLCFPIRNGFDPNEKSGRLNVQDSTITYTIQFQNTGNDTAQHIIVKDTLSSDLDITTLEVLNYSFQPFTQTFGNVAVFNFPNINLVDSATNESVSHGFVSFKIKVKPTALGSIQNQAAIYFDFNPPIYTNVALTELCYHPSFTKLDQFLCSSNPIIFNNHSLQNPGVYLDTMKNNKGCDSIITLSLKLGILPDTSVVQSGNALIAQAQHSSFYWYDCTQHQLIQNANDDTFMVHHSGSYAVLVKDSLTLCSDTSNCRTIVVSGVEEIESSRFSIYPNPCGEKLLVTGYQLLVNTIEVTDVLGRILMVRQAHHDGISVVGHADEGSISINVETLPSGIYFLKATDTKGNIMNAKFVKE